MKGQGVLAGVRLCAWCGEEATCTVEIEPPAYTSKPVFREQPDGTMKRQTVNVQIRAARIADACDRHSQPELVNESQQRAGRKRSARAWHGKQMRIE